MCKILIFGGTTEGRNLSEYCIKNGIKAYVSVATEYGANLLDGSESVKKLIGKMDADEILQFIRKKEISLVADATHPFAVEVTKNIKLACLKNGTKYIRVVRETEKATNGIYFNDMKSAAKYFCKTTGNIFVTTGSNELHELCCIKNFSARCVVRILPIEKLISKCLDLGFTRKNIITQRGPFSKYQNIEVIKNFNAQFLITKESGKTGGFEEKVLAAEECCAQLIIIKRPDDCGITVFQAERILTDNAE